MECRTDASQPEPGQDAAQHAGAGLTRDWQHGRERACWPGRRDAWDCPDLGSRCSGEDTWPLLGALRREHAGILLTRGAGCDSRVGGAGLPPADLEAAATA